MTPHGLLRIDFKTELFNILRERYRQARMYLFPSIVAEHKKPIFFSSRYFHTENIIIYAYNEKVEYILWSNSLNNQMKEVYIIKKKKILKDLT